MEEFRGLCAQHGETEPAKQESLARLVSATDSHLVAFIAPSSTVLPPAATDTPGVLRIAINGDKHTAANLLGTFTDGDSVPSGAEDNIECVQSDDVSTAGTRFARSGSVV